MKFRKEIVIDPDIVYEGSDEYLPSALLLKSAYDYQVFSFLHHNQKTKKEKQTPKKTLHLI